MCNDTFIVKSYTQIDTFFAQSSTRNRLWAQFQSSRGWTLNIQRQFHIKVQGAIKPRSVEALLPGNLLSHGTFEVKLFNNARNLLSPQSVVTFLYYYSEPWLPLPTGNFTFFLDAPMNWMYHISIFNQLLEGPFKEMATKSVWEIFLQLFWIYMNFNEQSLTVITKIYFLCTLIN